MENCARNEIRLLRLTSKVHFKVELDKGRNGNGKENGNERKLNNENDCRNHETIDVAQQGYAHSLVLEELFPSKEPANTSNVKKRSRLSQ